MTERVEGFQITADTSPLESAAHKGESVFSEFVERINEGGEKMASSLEGVAGAAGRAFEFAGAATAVELVNKVGEAIEKFGSQALELRTTADVLGVTTDQLQAMREAAERAGVGNEVLTHATEHLVNTLNEARNGSGAAIEKLVALGVTAEQIHDPTFTVSELLQVIHDRLVNASTKQAEMNELLLVFGPRAALAAEALAKYDGSAEGVAKTLAKINGLTKEQIDESAELKERWAELEQRITNASHKALLGFADFSRWLQQHNATARAVGNLVGVEPLEAPEHKEEKPEHEEGDVHALTDERIEARHKAATAEIQDIQLVTKADVDNARDALANFKNGTAERLAAVKEYARLAATFFGGPDVDKVREANKELASEQREFNASQKTQLAELVDFAESLDTRVTSQHAHALAERTAMDEKQAAEEQKQLEELVTFAQELDTKAKQEHSRTLQELTKFNKQQAEEIAKEWDKVGQKIGGALDGAFKQMIRGTFTLSGALRSIGENIVSNFLNVGARTLTSFIAVEEGKQRAAKATGEVQGQAARDGASQGLAASAGAALKQIANDAQSAGAAAYKATVGIPYVGPIIAPAAAAAAVAATVAFEGGIASAGRGFDVGNVAPLTQLHPNEMVLPAALADTIRDLSKERGRSYDQEPTTGGRKNVYVKPQAADGVLLMTPAKLKKLLEDLGHRGHIPGGAW